MSRPTVSVLAWDMGHNALGRAYVLADLLRDAYDVEIVGAHFPAFGMRVWRPLRNANMRMRTFEGTSLPTHFSTMERVAGDLRCDVAYVSKPRLPSMALGALVKERTSCSLLVDVDDHELAFFGVREACDLEHVIAHRRDPDFVKPYGRTWTRYTESLVPATDAVTVSNVALQGRLGGTIIPHARDEALFDPDLFDRDEARARLGFGPDDRVILFAGTAKAHKGVHEIAAALDAIGDERNTLVLFKATESRRLLRSLEGMAPWIRTLPYQRFEDLPRVLVCADLVCLLQEEGSEISRYQIPAKLTDAMAMGLPCLVRRTPAIAPLVDAGVIDELRPGEELPAAIERMLAEPSAADRRRRRQAFLDGYSYKAVRPVLHRVLEEAGRASGPLHADFGRLLSFHRSMYADDDVLRAGAGGQRPWREEAAERQAALAQGEVQRLVDALWRQVQHLDVELQRRTEIERIRDLVDQTVPVGEKVVVISRGDPALLVLGPRRVGHFFATPDGVYLGYHPASSEEAIEHLDAARRDGVRFLVVPESSSWWQEQYPAFWAHLLDTGDIAAAESGTGTVVALHDLHLSPSGKRAHASSEGRS